MQGDYIGAAMAKGLGLNLVTKCHFNYIAKIKTPAAKSISLPTILNH
jgi:hypothetical protein